jgi:ribonuclease HI
MKAAITAIKTARSLGVTRINIFYDWNGLELFSHRDNIKQRHNSCSQFVAYADFMEKARKNLRINFKKVKAHSGDELNNMVDRMAKAGRAI